MTAAQPCGRFASAFPALRLQMVLRGGTRRRLPFPLDNPSLQCFYLARNGIYALARAWGLSGQEILFPAYFHGVEVETLVAAGVKLRFYPVHAGMRVDTAEIRSCLTPQSRAVYLIHYLGFPGPVEELSAWCREQGLLLIEDCALAMLSKLGELPLGSFGDAAIFCLYKSVPVPNGGALLLRNPGVARLAKSNPPSLVSTIAYTAKAFWRNTEVTAGNKQAVKELTRSVSKPLRIVQVGGDHFDLSHANLAMSPLCRRILAGQKFETIVHLRRRNYLRLLHHLRHISPPVFPELPPGICPLFYPLQTRNKRTVLDHLLERGVEAVNFWSPISSVIPEGEFPEVDELRRTIVELPCHQDLTLAAVDRIASEVHSISQYLAD
jgi:perosamine synthetase